MARVSSKNRISESLDDNISDIIQIMNNAVLVFDDHGQVLSFNEHFTSLVLSGEGLQPEQKFSQIARIPDKKNNEDILDFIISKNGYEGSICFHIDHIDKTFENCSIKPLKLPNTDLCYWFLAINDTDSIAEELFKREQTIHAQYDNFPIPTYTWKRVGDDFLLVNFNLAAKSLTKNTIQKSIGKSYRIVMVHSPEFMTDIEQCFKSRKSFQIQRKYRFKFIDLSCDFDMKYVFIEPDMVMVHTEDITEKLRNVRELQKKEQRLEAIVSSLYKTAITVIDKDGTYTEAWADPIFEKLSGKSSKFLIGKNLHELKKLFAGDKPSVFDVLDKARLDKVLKEGKTKLLSYSFYVGNEKQYRESSLVPLRDKQGNIEGAVSYIRDVTERKLAEVELAKSEEWLRSIVTSLYKSAIFVLDYNGKFLGAWADPNFEAQVGIFANDLIGSNILKNHKEIFTQFPIEAMQGKLIAGEKPLTVEYLLETQKGKFWLSVSITDLKSISDKSLGVVVYIHDITDQKRAEERLIKSEEQLRFYVSELTLAEERERRKLAVTLHDEISQDLVTIKMQMELLLHGLNINLAKEKLPKLILMMNDALQKTKTLSFDLSPPILYELGLRNALVWLFERFSPKLKIPCTFNSDQINIKLDDDIKILLFQIVQELLVNIMKYANASKVNGHLKETGQILVVTVIDDGQGFDPEAVVVENGDLSHFGIFSIKERLKSFGGEMHISSALGEGCKTEIRIRPRK